MQGTNATLEVGSVIFKPTTWANGAKEDLMYAVVRIDESGIPVCSRLRLRDKRERFDGYGPFAYGSGTWFRESLDGCDVLTSAEFKEWASFQ